MIFCPDGYQRGFSASLNYKGASNLKPDPWNLHTISVGAAYLKTLENGDLLMVGVLLDVANANIGDGKRVELAQGGTIAETALFTGFTFAYLWTDIPSLHRKK